ncbi:hypothetical protein LTR70_009889 [Exophiala xenobiotica]|uniref:Zn(2)-C6 fungal-type domain-containing protein n=1 Tax=Lithohypha guttulata TaxID=1690604 RepID=A0ABR0JTT2_9EURO|nr:hypothetical protein LTR24_010481 [Lithohypha guttulata]KAK5309908.1 hypothetical protein LTR70_009889 [Exophiala xenobiotica]
MTSDAKPRTKGERLSLTCDACRSRHQKCNGARPSCHFCQFRGLSCGYPGVSDEEQPALRQKRVAGNQKPNTLSHKRSKQRTVSINDNDSHGAVQGILTLELAHKGVSSEEIYELARRLTNTVVPKSKLPDPQNQQASNTLVLETTGEQVLQVLTQLWKEKGHDLGVLPETAITATTSYATPSTWLLEDSHPNNNNLPLPSKKLAQAWLMTFLEGPNMLFCICHHAESLELLDALYDPQVVLSPVSMCVIFWQVTVGSRFSEVSEERVYRGFTYEMHLLAVREEEVVLGYSRYGWIFL